MTFIRKIGQAVIDFCYNSSAYSMTRELIRQRAELDTVLMLLILGDDLGVPVFPSYYSHRLWPYLLPHMASWKRALLRSRGWGIGELTGLISRLSLFVGDAFFQAVCE